jgi:quercetin dioxygenase-like cupin family protein
MAGTAQRGFTADNPLQIAYNFVRADSPWHEREPGVAVRDLGLAAASADVMSAFHVRAACGRGELAQIDDCDYRLVYVISGALNYESTGRETVRLEPGDVIRVPRAGDARLGFSEDFSALDIVDRCGAGGGKVQYLRDDDEAWTLGVGVPLEYFAYRDLRTAEATGGHVHTNEVRGAGTPRGGTGWHFHSMGQLFVILKGWNKICVAGHGMIEMGELDAMCISPGMVHNVTEWAAKYELVEVSIPAVYETTAVEVPAEFR